MKNKLINLREFLLEAYNKNEKPIGTVVWHTNAVSYCNETIKDDALKGSVFELNIMLIDRPKKARMWLLIYIDLLILELS